MFDKGMAAKGDRHQKKSKAWLHALNVESSFT